MRGQAGLLAEEHRQRCIGSPGFGGGDVGSELAHAVSAVLLVRLDERSGGGPGHAIVEEGERAFLELASHRFGGVA